MFDSLISLESLLAVSVGAIFSFKIAKVNANIKTEIRNQSPNINGDNNTVIYNEAVKNVKGEISLSIKLCILAIFVLFHSYPVFFLRLLISLSVFLPLFSFAGVVNVVRVNGFRRGWDFLYFIATLMMSVICYCAVQLMSKGIGLYPNLSGLFEQLRLEGVGALFHGGGALLPLLQIVISSLMCAALIAVSFYIAFGFVTARDGNGVLSYSMSFLALGYLFYYVAVNVYFNRGMVDQNYWLSALLYPFNLARYLISYLTS